MRKGGKERYERRKKEKLIERKRKKSGAYINKASLLHSRVGYWPYLQALG